MTARLVQVVFTLFTAASLIVSPVYAQSQGAPTKPPQSSSAQAQPQVRPQVPPPQYQPPPEAPAPPAAPPRRFGLRPHYFNGRSWFPDVLGPYQGVKAPAPVLTNTPRINQLIQNGKLMLSLEDAISLGLENNLNVAVARYTPWLNEANLLLAKSGATGRTSFDPSVASTLSLEQTSLPINNPFLSGVGTGTSVSALLEHTTTGNFTYKQGFHTGTQLQVTFNNSRNSSSSTRNTYNPYTQTSLGIQLTQPLLNGFGTLPNTRYIIEARNTVKVGQSQLRQQLISTVTQVATDYWELVYARENVKVEQVTVAADQQLYENNKKQLEVGTMSPLDVITAEAQLASDRHSLVQAQTSQLLDQTTLMVAITKDPLTPPLRNVEIVPTTPIYNPTPVSMSLQAAVKEAFQNRPELQQAALNLKNAGIEIKATKNGLLPQLDIFGLYSTQGLYGNSVLATPTGAIIGNVNEPIVFADGTPVSVTEAPGGPLYVPAAVTSTTTTFGGIGDAWDQMMHSKFPTFEGGITLTLPIRNRAAQARYAIAELTERQERTQYRATESSIVLNVRQALITLEQDRSALSAAEEARIYNQQSYNDEVKRLELGTSTAFTVVQKQQLLTVAEGTELRDRINLIEAELNFEQAVGNTLHAHDITMDNALSGVQSQPLNIPGTPDPAGLNR